MFLDLWQTLFMNRVEQNMNNQDFTCSLIYILHRPCMEK